VQLGLIEGFSAQTSETSGPRSRRRLLYPQDHHPGCTEFTLRGDLRGLPPRALITRLGISGTDTPEKLQCLPHSACLETACALKGGLPTVAASQGCWCLCSKALAAATLTRRANVGTVVC
jgi:hypothetical protein